MLKKEFKRIKSYGGRVITKMVDVMPKKHTVAGIEITRYSKKCNFDIEIAVIALDKLNNYDEIVLCSGDGDFEYLIRYLKNKKKKISVIAFSDMLSYRLKRATKFTTPIGTIRPLIKW